MLYWESFHVFVVCCFFPNSSFSKHSFRNTIRMSNSVDPDQARHFGKLGPSCLQKYQQRTLVCKELGICDRYQNLVCCPKSLTCSAEERHPEIPNTVCLNSVSKVLYFSTYAKQDLLYIRRNEKNSPVLFYL